ncbi:hypothetical protein B0H63DRAFT_494532 [Podospora didyma]|uniref:Uncharacterized protein n=1 Tax=Podospora didyma TaxID=330526 RepID=A0AAE0NQ25_9PEZI|nr:hypothetical protein B0H63DRAFT_494532 [Podospora didyma]
MCSFSTPPLAKLLGLSGVDLIAMVVSDSGLANCEPKWWNASPTGCMLIGLQPRGGWQIIQRAVQWGSDSWAKCFGVDCAAPILYAYFACTIRNRLEVLLSARLRSPMEGVPAGGQWNTWEDESFTVKRPTKLVDGSRGGQAFMAEVLAPEAGGGQYTIADQSRLQMLSVLMVGAGLAVDDSLASYWSAVLPADFDLSDGLGSVFGRLAIGLALGSLVAIGLMIATWWSLVATDDNVFGLALPYMVKIVSLLSWAVGAMGLLMLGGNPRVRLVDKDIPEHIKRRLATMKDEAEEPHPTADSDPKVRIQFGSLHGSVFLPDRGACMVRFSVVERLCASDIKTVRTTGWYIGMGWFGLLLVGSVALQVGATLAPAFGADLLSLVFLLATALARGAGVAGPEEWMIPRWKRRHNTSNGAILLGQFNSRAGGGEA